MSEQKTFEDAWFNRPIIMAEKLIGNYELSKKIAKVGWDARDPEIAEKDARIADLERKLERVMALPDKWKKDYVVPHNWQGTTFVSDTADALADQLRAALEEK